MVERLGRGGSSFFGPDGGVGRSLVGGGAGGGGYDEPVTVDGITGTDSSSGVRDSLDLDL